MVEQDVRMKVGDQQSRTVDMINPENSTLPITFIKIVKQNL
jgi:hypothetical protein